MTFFLGRADFNIFNFIKEDNKATVVFIRPIPWLTTVWGLNHHQASVSYRPSLSHAMANN